MPWDDELSEEQRRYASHDARTLRLVAGPGTGKTYVMTRRVAYLIEEGGTDANRILALTFTRAAAQELRERLEEMLGTERGDRPLVSTLHAFALRQLLRNSGAPNLPAPIRIADDYEERWVVQEEIARTTGTTVKKIEREFENLASDWETLKADEDEWERHHPSPTFLGAWRRHREVYGYTLRAELVYSVKKALEQNLGFDLERDFTHVLVDEYQDLNKCEIEVIRRLVGNGRALFAAGDDDQSIYAFRNAFPQGLREFDETYPDAVSGELTRCYRCDRDVLRLAQKVAEQDTERLPKALTTLDDAEDGDVRAFGFADSAAEASGISRIVGKLIEIGVAHHDILILLRNDPGGVYSKPIIEALAVEGIDADLQIDPFSVFKEPKPRLAVCLLRLLVDRADSLAWRQVLQLRDNKLGTTSLRAIYDLASELGERYAATLTAMESDPSVFPSSRRNIVRDEYRAITTLLNELELSRSKPVEDGLRDVLVSSGIDEDQSEEVHAVLLSLLEDVEGATLENLLIELNRLGTYKTDRPKSDDPVDRVRIMSMHSAKGLTADAVIIAACEDEQIPGPDKAKRAVDDQRRLLYVSLTRARHYLFVTYATSRPGEQTYRLKGAPPRRTYTSFLRDYLAPQLGR